MALSPERQSAWTSKIKKMVGLTSIAKFKDLTGSAVKGLINLRSYKLLIVT